MSRLMIVEVPSYTSEFKGIREVAELIRCAECKNCKRRNGTFKGEPIIFYRCEENNRDVESDDYCSWGERSE